MNLKKKIKEKEEIKDTLGQPFRNFDYLVKYSKLTFIDVPNRVNYSNKIREEFKDKDHAVILIE